MRIHKFIPGCAFLLTTRASSSVCQDGEGVLGLGLVGRNNEWPVACENHPPAKGTREVPSSGSETTRHPSCPADSSEGRVLAHPRRVHERPWQRPPWQQRQQQVAPRSSLAYRYYPRSQSRTLSAGSIPFLLLGPNVDHWKVTAEELASRGFNVMACERFSQEEEETGDEGEVGLDDERDEEASTEDVEVLVLELMDALRWRRVVLVGCDGDAFFLIRAAMRFAPDRVAGVVLCGDLSVAADRFSSDLHPHHQQPRWAAGTFALDRMLLDALPCPFAIVWDGDVPSSSSSSSSFPSSADQPSWEVLAASRCLILGGGSAPHRRRPQQFAWVLTRFVEENIAPGDARPIIVAPTARGGDQEQQGAAAPAPGRGLRLPSRLEEFLSSGSVSVVVVGRIAARLLFYVIAMKVVVFQYENAKSNLQMLSAAGKRVAGAALFFRFGRRRESSLRDSASDRDEQVALPDTECFKATEEDGEEEDQDRNDAEEQQDGDAEEREDEPQLVVPPYKPSYLLDRVIA